jgi:hypothetical protein
MLTFGSIKKNNANLILPEKGPHLHNTEGFYIHIDAAKDNQLNDKQTILLNKIFDTILNIGTQLSLHTHLTIP